MSLCYFSVRLKREFEGTASEDSDDSAKKIERRNNKKKFGKNPDVDTSFLPDRDREDEDNMMRETLRYGRMLAVDKCVLIVCLHGGMVFLGPRGAI